MEFTLLVYPQKFTRYIHKYVYMYTVVIQGRNCFDAHLKCHNIKYLWYTPPPPKMVQPSSLPEELDPILSYLKVIWWVQRNCKFPRNKGFSFILLMAVTRDEVCSEWDQMLLQDESHQRAIRNRIGNNRKLLIRKQKTTCISMWE